LKKNRKPHPSIGEDNIRGKFWPDKQSTTKQVDVGWTRTIKQLLCPLFAVPFLRYLILALQLCPDQDVHQSKLPQRSAQVEPPASILIDHLVVSRYIQKDVKNISSTSKNKFNWSNKCQLIFPNMNLIL
jgi:hypothetical protein